VVSPHPPGLPEPLAAQADATFSDLLHRHAHGMAPAAAPAPGPVHGQVLLGQLQALPSLGQPGMAVVPGLGPLAISHSLVPLVPGLIGKGVALSLLAADQALVLGLVWEAAAPGSPPLALVVDGQRTVVEAERELELRCGDAAIVLTADGRIQLRGTYITSHASATQRIVGGSVHVN
jgi:hypothetical protein